MEVTFRILAVILAGIAAYFLWNGNKDGAFIAAVFAAVSFFLSIRFQVKGRLKQREAEREAEQQRIDDEAEISDTESSLLNEMTAHEQINNEQRTTDKEQKI